MTPWQDDAPPWRDDEFWAEVESEDAPGDPWTRVPDTAPLEESGYYYFIHAPDVGMVKIGYSIDPEERLLSLQIGSPCKLYLIAKYPGDVEDERALHARFSSYRSHGEWFKDSILRSMGITSAAIMQSEWE